jgi:hypothetical protein
MMGFTFVEAYLGAALHVGIQQPIDDKECPFDPSDFTKSDSKIVLPWMGWELLQELAGWHDARDQFERDLLIERTQSGLAREKAEGMRQPSAVNMTRTIRNGASSFLGVSNLSFPKSVPFSGEINFVRVSFLDELTYPIAHASHSAS